MIEWFRHRYLDLLGSIYIYNEHRGYTAIDRVIEAVRRRTPPDRRFLEAIEQHRADERKHYEMFRRWFQLRGVMPFLRLTRCFPRTCSPQAKSGCMQAASGMALVCCAGQGAWLNEST